MGRFVNDTTGVIVSVSDEKDDRYVSGWSVAGETPAAQEAYSSMKVGELHAEIDSRNKGRDEPIEPQSAKKADLIAALEADDK